MSDAVQWQNVCHTPTPGGSCLNHRNNIKALLRILVIPTVSSYDNYEEMLRSGDVVTAEPTLADEWDNQRLRNRYHGISRVHPLGQQNCATESSTHVETMYLQ